MPIKYRGIPHWSVRLNHGLSHIGVSRVTTSHINKSDPLSHVKFCTCTYVWNPMTKWDNLMLDPLYDSYKIILSSDLFLRYQIQLSAFVVDNISIGSNKNINFACQYSRLIDNVEHVFDVTQVGFQKKVLPGHSGLLLSSTGEYYFENQRRI